jgi:hypothetical protein
MINSGTLSCTGGANGSGTGSANGSGTGSANGSGTGSANGSGTGSANGSGTGSANQVRQTSGPVQGWKGEEVLSSDTLEKRSDNWTDTATRIKKCANIY